MPATFTLTDVDVFDGERMLGRGYITVSDDKIQDVALGQFNPKTGTSHRVISTPGHTVLPGFIDSHVHVQEDDPTALHQALSFGVTTVMDMHNENSNIVTLKAYAARFWDKAADIKAAGVAATIDGGWPIPIVVAHDQSARSIAAISRYPKLRSAEDARLYVKHNVSMGADYIKLMHESGQALGERFVKPSIELQRSVVREAHLAGKVAVAHAMSLDDHMEMLQCGVDGMTHAFFDQTPTREIVEAYKRSNAWLNPTLAAIGSLTGEGQAKAQSVAHDGRIKQLLSDEDVGRMCKCLGFHADTSRIEFAYQLV